MATPTGSSSSTHHPRPPAVQLSSLLARGVTSAFVLALSVTLTAIFILGAYDTLRNVEENKCLMTWMFDYPLFTQIPVDHTPLEDDTTTYHHHPPPYKLYVYSEGTTPRSPDAPYTGIPVLFIPGNAGSFKQVRSLASVSLQKERSSPDAFDYFTLDLNGEYSGLYGYVLDRQRRFALDAIRTIQSLYPATYHSVILIGHSIGGLVAKSTLTDIQTPLIITLATPHAKPPLILDPLIDLFYHKLNRASSSDDNNTTTVIVSIAGGHNDPLVPQQHTTTLHSSAINHIQTTTTRIPGVWASTDHLCIVWCKQLVLTLNRALFDSVDQDHHDHSSPATITPNTTLIKEIFNYHLIHRSAGKSYHTTTGRHQSSTASVPPPSPTVHHVEILTLSFCTTPATKRHTHFVMFPTIVLNEKRTANAITFTTNNTHAKQWIFLCLSQSVTNNIRHCSRWSSMSEVTRLLPHSTPTSRRKTATLPLAALSSGSSSHVIVRLDPSSKPTCVHAQPHPPTTTVTPKIHLTSTSFAQFTVPFQRGLLPQLFAWSLTPTHHHNCSHVDAIATFTHSHFSLSRFIRNESLVIRLSSRGDPDQSSSPPLLTINTSPECNTTLVLSVATLETAGQVFSTFSRLLPSYLTSVLLLTLHHQTSPTTHFDNIHSVLLANPTQLTLAPAITVAALQTILTTDWPEDLASPLTHVILFPIAYTLLLAAAATLSIAITQLGGATHAILASLLTSRIFSRFLPRWLTSSRLPSASAAAPTSSYVAEVALDMTFERFPVLLSVFLVSLTLATSGGTALAATLAVYLVKLFKIYDDALSDLLKGKISSVADALSPFNFHLTFALVHVVLTALNLPSLLHWLNNNTSTTTGGIQHDVSLYLALMVTPTTAVLLQHNTPHFYPPLWTLHRWVFYVMAIVIPLWTSFRLYLISFILTFTLITTATCQLISLIPSAVSSDGSGSGDNPDDRPSEQKQQKKNKKKD